MNLLKTISTLLVMGSLFTVIPACGQKGGTKSLEKYYSKVSSVPLASTNDSFFYALGFNMASDLKGFFKSNKIEKDFDLDVYLKGFLEAYQEKKGTFASADESRQFFAKTIQEIQAKVAEVNKKEEMKFFEQNKKKPGVKELPNGQGIQYQVIKSGTGATPTLADEVQCHYVGTLVDGTEFDNSVKRGQPAEFPLGGVIKGWQLALAQMKEGDKWKVFIPSELGYGARGAGGAIPPNATLVFEVELIKVKKAESKK